jgi:hypothetical protein
MFESSRHAEWETVADTTVRTDRVGHRHRQLLKLLPADVYHEILEVIADWELGLQRCKHRWCRDTATKQRH